MKLRCARLSRCAKSSRGTQALQFTVSTEDAGRYRWIEWVLRRIRYRALPRPSRGVVLAYLQRLNGLCSAFMQFAQLRVRQTNMTSSTRDRAVPNRPAVSDGSGRDCTARGPAARRPGRGDPDAAPATRLIRRTRREAAVHRSSDRVGFALLSRFFKWRDALVVVRPATMIRWHRAGWRLFWRLTCRPGRLCISKQVQDLIRRMGSENPTWGEERIANELFLKLGIQISPRTVRKYLPPRPPGRPRGIPYQDWVPVLRNPH